VETALVLVLPDAEPFDAVRRDYAAEAVAHGIPFHITLLYPFAPREAVTDALLMDVRSFFAQREPLSLTLTRVAAWPSVVYAVPEPDTRLRAYMRALFQRYPQYRPYSGAHADVVPHATLAEDVDAKAVLADIERRIAPYLPRRYNIEAAMLLEEATPNAWRPREELPFARPRLETGA
jgi:2'-5' RNA ligase